MLLLIDAGNTRVKWALADARAAAPGDWIAAGAVPHGDVAQLGPRWQAEPVDAVLVSNVAGAAMAARLQEQLQPLQQARAVKVDWFAARAAVAGIRNGYREPERLGCDRLASLAGARALLPGQALIVATCGTATTVDALDADGRFIGGLILPGLATMAASLAQRTAQLPVLATPCAPAEAAATPLFADHTDAAIRNGCLAAQAGAIERAIAAHGAAHCLLSGGAAAWIAPWLRSACTVVDNLVLIGLQVIAVADAATDPAASTAMQASAGPAAGAGTADDSADTSTDEPGAGPMVDSGARSARDPGADSPLDFSADSTHDAGNLSRDMRAGSDYEND